MARGSNPRSAAPAAALTETANKAPSADAEQLGIDGILERLEGVVRELESGDLPLETALARFEDGVRLARRGSQVLDAVEQRVETLMLDRDATTSTVDREGGTST